MKTLLPIILFFCGLACMISDTSPAKEFEDLYSDYESLTESPEEQNELLSIEVSKTKLNLILLGTVVNDNVSRALVKNPVTGEIGSYTAGERLDLVASGNVKVVEVSKCVVLIQRDGIYETMQCNNKIPTVVFNGPSVLAKYKIVRPGTVGNKNISTNFSSDYDKDIVTLSEKHDVDPYLVKAVIKAESNFDPNAVSPKNAQGIMQLVPETASDYGVINTFDPIENMDGGVRYLKDLLEYFDGDINLSLAAYNAGKGAVIKHGFTIPPYPETADYITKVLGYYKLLKAKNYAMKK